MSDSVSRARLSAFEVLHRVATEEAFAGPLLATGGSPPLSAEDQHLRQVLTLGVLRRQGWLDHLIKRLSGRPVERLDPEVVISLRLGIYQLKFLSRIPAHAAINESVNLVKLARKRSAAPFVNAVLRAAQRSGELPVSWLPEDPLERLSITASTPLWILERWCQRWGFEEAAELATANLSVPSHTIRFNQQLSPRRVTEEWMGQQGIRTRPSVLVPTASVLIDGSLSPDSMPVKEGWVYFQEESSQLVARLSIPDEPGLSPQSFWDACAAPGGKSAMISSLLPKGSRHIATDRLESRIRLMRQLLARHRLLARINVAQVDLTVESPFQQECFDLILVDAPCSGLGTIQKNPEIKWRLTPGKIDELAQMQRRIIETAALSLRPGGVLTYSVCSTEKEEGEDVIGWFRERHPEYRDITRERLEALGLDPHSFITATGGARTFPHHHQTEGLFVCVLWKRR